VSDDDMAELLRVNTEEWRAEVPSIREHYAKFGERLPSALTAEVDDLEKRLG
jgi:phosphoenolpyruvate carboxykinase (GTP)